MNDNTPMFQLTDAQAPEPVEAEQSGSGPLSVEDLHVDDFLNIVVDRNASDLHISANCEPVIREDGKLKRLNYQRFTPQITQRMMYDILSDEHIHRFETTLELDFSYALPKRARFRVNCFRDRGSVASAFRLIPQKIPTVKELNLPPILEKLTEKPRGLILVTGPTGHGKSTSLAAMINKINEDRAEHIITIEDPIEYLHVNKLSVINQRELGHDTKSFANAFGRPFAKTRTSCSWVKCATWRRFSSRSRPLKRATWCSRPCTRTRPLNRSTVSSTCSPRGSRSRFAFSSPTIFKQWFRNSFFLGRARRDASPRSRS